MGHVRATHQETKHALRRLGNTLIDVFVSGCGTISPGMPGRNRWEAALDTVAGVLAAEGRAFHVIGEPVAGPARSLLTRHYGGCTDVLPAEVQAWLESDRQPLISLRDGHRLEVRYVPGGRGADLLWLEERRSEPDAESLLRLGLSEREAEVLWLLTRGRSVNQIAADLGISVGTVKKHLEHVYRKLGVSTAGAAVAVAFDTMSAS